jgi:hypothetical protein
MEERMSRNFKASSDMGGKWLTKRSKKKAAYHKKQSNKKKRSELGLLAIAKNHI